MANNARSKLIMQARFRSDYPGEFVVVNTVWENGKRTEQREWIANPIDNQHISGRAVCIGSRDSLQSPFPMGIDYTILQRHRGGLLGTLKVQTYGVGSIAEDMRLDFAVDVDSAQLKKLVDTKYYENHVVYTTARNCIDNPGNFYLIPQSPRLLMPALPVYLAAFDGHTEIFLLGYSKQMQFDNPRWFDQVNDVFSSYTGVKFYLVGEPTIMPDSWLECVNVSTMSYRDFIGYCDV
jgi:hypothetical protein